MNVDQVIEALQKLSAQGHGNLPVTTYNDVDEGGGFVSEIEIYRREDCEDYDEIDPDPDDIKMYHELYYKGDRPFDLSTIDAHVAIISDGSIEP